RWPDRGHKSLRPQDLGEAALTPAELLAEARSLICRPDASMAGVWPRTAAFLTRQALEEAVNARWAASSATSAMLNASMWSRLACLPAYVSGPEARQAIFAYAALSSACHYHPYELAPTAAELNGWIDDVEALVAELGQAAPVA
ncbi:MAG: hypothetical protein ABSB76_29785, partial [Streptosporangiaceae bacterium]